MSIPSITCELLPDPEHGQPIIEGIEQGSEDPTWECERGIAQHAGPRLPTTQGTSEDHPQPIQSDWQPWDMWMLSLQPARTWHQEEPSTSSGWPEANVTVLAPGRHRTGQIHGEKGSSHNSKGPHMTARH